MYSRSSGCACSGSASASATAPQPAQLSAGTCMAPPHGNLPEASTASYAAYKGVERELFACLHALESTTAEPVPQEGIHGPVCVPAKVRLGQTGRFLLLRSFLMLQSCLLSTALAKLRTSICTWSIIHSVLSSSASLLKQRYHRKGLQTARAFGQMGFVATTPSHFVHTPATLLHIRLHTLLHTLLPHTAKHSSAPHNITHATLTASTSETGSCCFQAGRESQGVGRGPGSIASLFHPPTVVQKQPVDDGACITQAGGM